MAATPIVRTSVPAGERMLVSVVAAVQLALDDLASGQQMAAIRKLRLAVKFSRVDTKELEASMDRMNGSIDSRGLRLHEIDQALRSQVATATEEGLVQ